MIHECAYVRTRTHKHAHTYNNAYTHTGLPACRASQSAARSACETRTRAAATAGSSGAQSQVISQPQTMVWIIGKVSQKARLKMGSQ